MWRAHTRLVLSVRYHAIENDRYIIIIVYTVLYNNINST